MTQDKTRKSFKKIGVALSELGPQNDAGKSTGLIGKIFENYEQGKNGKPPLSGLETKIQNLDEMLNGLKKGHLIAIGARPSMGKTWFALNIAHQIAIKQNRPVLLIELEMTIEELAYRILSLMTGLNPTKIERGQLSSEAECETLIKAYGEFSASNLYIVDDTNNELLETFVNNLTIDQSIYNFELIIIDHIQLMKIKGETRNRNNDIGDVSRGLKSTARTFNIPIIALSQLSRKVEERIDKRPILSDLRDSGAIEQDADEVIFMYREAVYNPETEKPYAIEIIIAKNRSGGKLGTVDCWFNPDSWIIEGEKGNEISNSSKDASVKETNVPSHNNESCAPHPNYVHKYRPELNFNENEQ